MYINDLIMQVKKGSISDLLPLSLITTDKDVKKFNNNGYIVHKLDEFLKDYPELSNYIDYLYYDNSFGCQIIYYNTDDLILIETNIYSGYDGFQSLLEVNRLLDLIVSYKTMSFDKKYYFISERFRLEFILRNIDKIPDKYHYFVDAYSMSDYGFEKLKKNDIVSIFNYKTNKDIKLTKEKLKDLPNELVVYRGIGSKSLRDGYSYTLNFDVARFFAFRLSKRDDYVEILEAKVKKSDVIEYLTDRNEDEVLILPDKVFDKRIYKYHSFDKFSVDFDIFSDYRELLLDYLEFNALSLSDEHGINHLLRVLVLSQLLADKYNISNEYKDLLFKASVFHDVGRQNDDEDSVHGLNSYNLLCNYDISYQDERLKYLMLNHCIDDSNIKRMKNKELNLCLDILKDADALDRQRFGIKVLNSNYLRLSFSKKLSFYAFKLLNVKMFE